MSASITAIRQPFEQEMKEYDKVFATIMASNITLIDTIVKYIVKHKGKNLRPLLVIMSAKLINPPNRNTYIVASIVVVLAQKAGVGILPLAHNAGVCWPRKEFIKRPGTVTFRFLPYLPAEEVRTRKRNDLLNDLKEQIESATRSLGG